MAHARIIQVSVERINESDRMNASDFDVDMLRYEIDDFDYCVDTSNRADDLKWFKEQLERVGFTLDGDTIIVGNDDSFLDKWRSEAVKAANELDLYKMRSLSSGVYFSGFYIYDNEIGYPIPLWAWAKDALETSPTFYVGGIIDYHL